MNDGRGLVALSLLALVGAAAARGSRGIARSTRKSEEQTGSVIRFRASESPAAAAYTARTGLTVPSHYGFELEGKLDAWAKQVDPGGYAMTPGEDWDTLDVVLPSVPMSVIVHGIRQIVQDVEGPDSFQTWTWTRYSREDLPTLQEG